MIEKVQGVALSGYRVRCSRCGAAGPVAQTEADAVGQATAAGWVCNTLDLGDGSQVEDWCPACIAAREAELDEDLSLDPECKGEIQ